MRILILGASGMLGSTLMCYYNRIPEFNVLGTVRSSSKKDLLLEKGNYYILDGVSVDPFESIAEVVHSFRPSYVLNCIGIIKQDSLSTDSLSSIEINSRLPHLIANCCDEANARLIHFSTDCVFSGNKGLYKESDVCDATDVYGKSKFLGEIHRTPHLTLRTSIIGHELDTNISLVDWFLDQNRLVYGYKNAIFSGLPTYYLAKVLHEFVIGKSVSGLYHLSLDPISKLELLGLIKSKYKKNISILPCSNYTIDRSLDSSRFKRATGYQGINWVQAVETMYEGYRLMFER